MNSLSIPFLNLRAHHDPIRRELLDAITEVIGQDAFAGGPFTARFEEEFAVHCRTRFASGVGSGTDALWFALQALGVGPGDEVITVPATFIATAEAITACGARPVFVDIDEHTHTMDPALIEPAITPRTRAIVPVHLYGQMADMDPIMDIARRHNLRVVEDACQAHGAEYKGHRAGSIGDAGCFSFYPGKNLGALGEAGAVVSNDAELTRRIRMLRDHGQDAKYHHACIGWNGRMDGIQAAVLSVKLKRLDAGNAARRNHAAVYDLLLGGSGKIGLPRTAPWRTHVFHLYVVRVKARDRVLRAMAQHGVSCGIHYPVPLHLQPAYASLGWGPGSFPEAERAAEEVLSLPMFPELTEAQLEAAAAGLKLAVAALPAPQLLPA